LSSSTSREDVILDGLRRIALENEYRSVTQELSARSPAVPNGDVDPALLAETKVRLEADIGTLVQENKAMLPAAMGIELGELEDFLMRRQQTYQMRYTRMKRDVVQTAEAVGDLEGQIEAIDRRIDLMAQRKGRLVNNQTRPPRSDPRPARRRFEELSR
jgi:hypothetical protein